MMKTHRAQRRTIIWVKNSRTHDFALFFARYLESIAFSKIMLHARVTEKERERPTKVIHTMPCALLTYTRAHAETAWRTELRGAEIFRRDFPRIAFSRRASSLG